MVVLDLRSVGLLLDELLLCDPDAVLNHLALAIGLREIVGVQGVRVVGTRASRGEKSRIAREHREHCVIRYVALQNRHGRFCNPRPGSFLACDPMQGMNPRPGIRQIPGRDVGTAGGWVPKIHP